MPPRKCLFIMHSHGGGAEKVCLTLLAHLPQAQFGCKLGCIHAIDALRAELQGKIAYIMPDHPGFWQKCKNMYALWKEARRSDCVVGSLELQSIFGAALLAPHKSIGWLHKDLRGYCAQKSFLFGLFYRQLFAWCAKRCLRIVCVSRGVQQSAQELFPKFAEKFVYIPNPIDIQDIYTSSQAPLPVALYTTFQHKVILGTGRLAPEKAFQNLIQAHALLRQWGHDQHLCILGEGPERARLEALCCTLGLEDSVILPGFMSPYAPMRQASVFALSSDFEGLPLVLQEALALGLPVVSTDCPSGPREALEGGKLGTLVPLNDIDAFAKALLPFITDSPPDTERRARGQARAKEFDVSQCLEAWRHLLHSTEAS